MLMDDKGTGAELAPLIALMVVVFVIGAIAVGINAIVDYRSRK